ncbi:MAG: S8 family serine peptidase [Bacteroidota bacterium]
MQKFKLPLYALAIILFSATQTMAQKLDHVQGEIIVEVRDDKSLNSLFQDLFDGSSMRASSGTTIQTKEIIKEPMNLWVLKIDHTKVNEIEFLNEITSNRNVLQAQFNHITRLRAIPDDPNFSQQWQFINTGQNGGTPDADIDIELAWDFATGGLTTEGDTIVICVIDDGVNLNHPDFGDNLWFNHQEIDGNGIDDDGNGYVDDFRGWSAYEDNDNVTVDGDHGTQVAGVVGAKGNNSIGVSGINWDVKIMNVRGEGPEALALASYAYPYTMRKMYNESNGEKGAFVVCTNASWGIDFGQAEEAPIWCDFYNMLGEIGILNFGATANRNINVDIEGDLPTTCESNYLVGVTNMNRFDDKHQNAGFGVRHIDLGAFGQQIHTLTLNSYGSFGGTSGASPMVAGTAALLYSADCPDFISFSKSNPAQAALVIKDCILHGVDPNEALKDITTTGGRLNANLAMQNLLSTCGSCAEALGNDIGEITDERGTLTWFDNNNVGSTSMRYKQLTENTWTEVTNVESGYVLDDLLACTSYEYQVRTDCQSNPNTEYTYSRIFTTDGCCDIPAGIMIALEGEDAILQWEDVLAATNFEVQWREAGEVEWNSIDLGKDNMYTLEGVTACKFFELRVKSECAATSNESMYSEIIKINGECEGCTREFCSFGVKNVSDEYIESVEIEDVFVNQSGVSETGYGNFLGNFEINLQAEEEYTLNLTPGFTDVPFDEYFSAYIDYNQNGEFEEEDEAIFISEQFTQSAVSGNFIVPTSAKPGITRMRIVMRFDALNGPCDELNFEYGEVEDYCVTIINDFDCSSTFGAIVTDTTETSLTFEVLQNDMAQFHLIAIREAGEVDFLIATSQINEIVIPNLIKCTEYEYSSGYICDGETFIDSEIFNIRTKCDVGNENVEELRFTLFPNPSNGDLNVSFDEINQQDIQLDLYSNEGRVVFSKFMLSGEASMAIDMSEIPPGLYFLKASMDKKVSFRKWIKY